MRLAIGWTVVGLAAACAAALPAAAQAPAPSVTFTDTKAISIKLDDVRAQRGVVVRLTNLLARSQPVTVQLVGLRPVDAWTAGRFRAARVTLDRRASADVTVPLVRGGVGPMQKSYTGVIVLVGTAGPLPRLKVTITDTGFQPGASNPCATADALRKARQDDEAKAAYQEVLKNHPNAECATKQLRHRDATSAGKHVLNVLTGFGLMVLEWVALGAGVLALLTWLLSRPVSTRQWLVDRPRVGPWLDRRLAPRMRLSAFDDDTGFTALVREQLVREAIDGDYRLDRVTARDSIGTILGSVDGVNPSLKTLGVVLDAVEQLLPRKRFDVWGAVQTSKGPDGEGATVLLEGGLDPVATTLWLGPNAGEGHQQLAVPAAAWIDWEVHSALGAPPPVGDARSYALLQGALDCERRGDHTGAERLYDQAIAADPMNLPAIINLANLKARGRQEYLDAVHELRGAVELLHAEP